MDLQFQMQLRQSQKLIMTPSLRQAIEVLQYNSVELKDYIEEQMLENPVLEYREKTTEAADDVLQKIAWMNEGSRTYNSYGGKQYDADKDYNYEQIVADGESLHEHLFAQLRLTALKDDDYELAQYIIQHIDERGYLFIDEAQTLVRFNVDEDELEEIIQRIQTFEPYGVAARNLAECLTIQLQMRAIRDEAAYKIVEFHMDDLANNHIVHIAKSLELSCHDVQRACDIIKSLNPKPGLSYGKNSNVRYLQPDIELKKLDGEYVVILNDVASPRLRLSSYYQKILNNQSLDKNTMSYINSKLSNALDLIKSIEQRRSTIRAVVEEIVQRQRDFFDKGQLHLKTLNLKDVADAIGVHESTVSRAVNGKYLQCRRGLYELKYFFPSGVSSDDGEAVSAQSIKSIIVDIIAKEDPKKPISDQKIANQLAAIGVSISRRTIAKYRESLNIPGSSKRKRY